MNTDYSIEALPILLNRDCLAERYYPLIPYRDSLLVGLRSLGVQTKDRAAALPDEAYTAMGLDPKLLPLLRRFWSLYDPAPQKLREIPKVVPDPAQEAAYGELYLLPGVRAVRADLYCRAGYRSLQSLAEADPETVRSRTARAIADGGLSCTVPLPKEIRTHIAVARALLLPRCEV